jgi:hypothetical protein
MSQMILGIETFTDWNATITPASPGWYITIIAKYAGPDYNYTSIGGGSTNNQPLGGAYAWQSAASPCGSQITVWFTSTPGEVGSYNLNVYEAYPDLSTSYQYLVGGTPVYSFVGNNYGFAIVPMAPTSGPWESFYFTQVPYCPLGSCTSAAFAEWDGSQSLSSGDFGHYELNGTSIGPGSVAGRGFVVATLSTDGSTNSPIRTKANNKLVDSALCGIGSLADGVTYLVGYLYDCILVCDAFPLASSITFGGHTWICILSEYNQSVFLCTV